MRYVVVGGLATQEVGEELLLCDASGSAVHRISGDARRHFERVAQGDGELPDDQVTAALVAANVLLPVGTDGTISRTEGMSRRRVMALSAAAAAAAGVATIGLPSAAAAQSPGPGPDPGPFPPVPEGGTGGGTEGRYNADSPQVSTNTFAVFDGWIESTRRGQASITWEVVTSVTPEVVFTPVNFNYRLEAPLGTLRGEGGSVDGSTPNVFASNVDQGDPYTWFLTASNGVQQTITGNFS